MCEVDALRAFIGFVCLSSSQKQTCHPDALVKTHNAMSAANPGAHWNNNILCVCVFGSIAIATGAIRVLTIVDRCCTAC